MSSTVFKREYTYRALVAGLIIIIFSGILHTIFTSSKPAPRQNFAVLTEDAPLFFDSELSIPANELKRDDLVYLLYKDSEDVFYVTSADFAEGYISKEKLSFKFDFANQARITSTEVFESPVTGVAVPNLNPQDIVCSIKEIYGDWYGINLHENDNTFWIRSENLSYDFPVDTNETGEYYKQIKDYLQSEYLKAYRPYYDATVVRTLSGYSEAIKNGSITSEFTMTASHRLHIKDPDSVDYINDAKNMIEENDDDYYRELYISYYNKQNKLLASNYALKLTADIKGGKIKEVRLFDNSSPDSESGVRELENGFADYIIE